MKILTRCLLLTIFLLVTNIASAQVVSWQLSWQDNSTNELGFRVYRRNALPIGSPWVEVGTTGADVVTYKEPRGANNVCYRVTAFNSAGESGATNDACTTDLLVDPSGIRLRWVIEGP
jgi:hypothetical protein